MRRSRQVAFDSMRKGGLPESGLRSIVEDGSTSMKSFPRHPRGVLLPSHDRRAAALALCLYTAGRPYVVRMQHAAYWAVRLCGSRVLPTRHGYATLPGGVDDRRELARQWEAALGPIDNVGVFMRKQAHRFGATMIATRRGRPVAIIKVRQRGPGLLTEQRALECLSAASTTTFQAPKPLGHGTVGDWEWAAQQAVFTRPHAPVMVAPDELFVELREVLSKVPAAASAGTDGRSAPAHGDLTPWNLRRDHRGTVWLFDFEESGPAPIGYDEVVFSISSRALGGRGPRPGLPQPALDHFRQVVSEWVRRSARHDALNRALLDALDEAETESVG